MFQVYIKSKAILFTLFFIILSINRMEGQVLNCETTNDCYQFIFKQNKQIYLLGENDHEEKNTQKLKSELVVKAFSEKNVDLLMFESDFGESIALYLSKKYSRDPVDDIEVISRIWHSVFTKKMFDSLDFNSNSLNFIGIDILPNSQLFNNWIYSELKKKGYSKIDEFDKTNRFIVHKTWSNILNIEQSNLFNEQYDNVIDFITKTNSDYNKFDLILVINALENRKKLISYLSLKKVNRLRYRDSCMAKNINWIDSNLKNEKSTVVWGHNGHISYKEYEESLFFVSNLTPFGSLLNDKIKAKSLNIAISSPNSNSKVSINNPSKKFPKNSIEYKLAKVKLYSIIDLKSKDFNQCGSKMDNFTIGKTKSALCDQFDLLIVLREGYY